MIVVSSVHNTEHNLNTNHDTRTYIDVHDSPVINVIASCRIWGSTGYGPTQARYQATAQDRPQLWDDLDVIAVGKVPPGPEGGVGVPEHVQATSGPSHLTRLLQEDVAKDGRAQMDANGARGTRHAFLQALRPLDPAQRAHVRR